MENTTRTGHAKPKTMAAILKDFRKYIVVRAAREGVDVSRLQIEGATLEASWGDRVGYVFFGCADDVNERVAKCFEAYAQKHSSSGSYEAQRSISLRGPRYFHWYTNGAKGWHETETAGPEITMPDGFVIKLARPIEKGWSVATTYYPCAD